MPFPLLTLDDTERIERAAALRSMEMVAISELAKEMDGEPSAMQV